jgi:hypothetical protein
MLQGVAACLLLVGGMLVPAQPAAAAVPGLIRAAGASSLTGSEDQKTASVTCPDNKVVLGAGYEVTGAAGAVVVDVLRPGGSLVAAPRSVFLHATEVDPFGGNWRVTVYATCATVSHVVRASRATPSQTGDTAEIAVDCPTGLTMTGTGFEVNRFGSVVVDQIQPGGGLSLAPRGAGARAHVADEFPGTWILLAYAICTDQVPGLERILGVGTIGSSSSVAEATCPDNKVATGGGYDLPARSGDLVVDDFRPNGGPATAPTSNRVVGFEEDAFAEDWLVISYAICATR